MKGLSDFNFHLIKLRESTDRRSTALINEAYFFWKGFWSKELSKNEAPFPKWSDEFYRHDAIGIITLEDMPVAMHLYGIQNLKTSPCQGQSYFEKGFDESFCSKALKNGYGMAMSAGWLTVNEDFVKNPLNIVFSRCLMALALKASSALGCQAVIGPTRADNGMAAKIMEWGAVSYGVSDLNNTPVEMLVMDNSIEIPLKENETKLLTALWSSPESAYKKAA